MATVVYLPATTFVNSGSAAKSDEEEKAAKSEKLAELFGNLNKEDSPERTSAIQQNIAGGAIESEGSLISLISQMRANKDAGTIKIDAFDSKGNKVPFALSKKDLATVAGEDKANKFGLTLTNKGPQTDFFEDSATQKFIGVGSKNSRPAGKITLDEWKSKYGKKKTATDKDTAISDYLKGSKDKSGKTFQNTAINRKRAREFLGQRGKAIEVINAAFGKKTGNDWTIDDPIKNQMAIIAKGLVETFIMNEGSSAEQAGAATVQLVKEVFKDKIVPDDGTDINKKVEIRKGGFMEDIKNLFSSNEEKSAETVRKSPDYIGDFNDIPIEVPADITSPRAAMEYIMKTYKMSKEDARSFLLDQQPTE